MVDSDDRRAIGVLLAMVLQAAASPVLLGLGLGDQVGDQFARRDSPVQPANYAFGIWLLIYLWCIAMGVYQFLPGQRTRTVHRRTGWWVVLAGVANVGWLVAVMSFAAFTVSVVAILLIVAGCAIAWRRLAVLVEPVGWNDRIWLWSPITLYLGWVTVAALTNITVLWWPAVDYGGAGMAALIAATAAALGGIAALAALTTWRAPEPLAFAVAVAWALTAVVVGPVPFAISLLAGIGVIAQAVAMWGRQALA